MRILGVRDNIGAFGGDPENIVAIGQSVGASSIGLHIVSYEGKQGVPFQKAMSVGLSLVPHDSGTDQSLQA